jgi:hypothetical protein
VASSSVSAPAAATSSSAPSIPADFTGTCFDLLPVTLVNAALGRPVIGKTNFVVGVAEPDIGRLAYLNCRYGIPAAVKGKPAPTAQVEIGVSLYDSVAQAARRLQGTIVNYLSNGASRADTVAGTYPVTVLTGYGDPTVVGALGQRTVAISVRSTLFLGSPTGGLTALAKAVLDATAVPGAVGAPTAIGSPAVS